MPYEYDAELVRVIDGDTVVLEIFKDFPQEIDFGFNIKDTVILRKNAKMHFRLYGIDTCELKSHILNEKEKAEEAKAKLYELLFGRKLKIITYKPDKYGRWLATIFVVEENGSQTNINESLVTLGLAVPYII